LTSSKWFFNEIRFRAAAATRRIFASNGKWIKFVLTTPLEYSF